jgi:tetratricopeptide (TPR) repeat protein
VDEADMNPHTGERLMKKGTIVLHALIFGIAVVLASHAVLADYKLAVALYNRGQYDKAIQELKPDLDANPDWESGQRMLGLCYLNLKNNALAISALTRAVQLKSTTPATYIGLGHAYFNMQKYDECLQALNQGEPFLANIKQGAEAQRYEFYRLRGSVNLRLQKSAEAAEDFTQALRSGSSDWTDFSQLGNAYYNLGRLDDAIQALQKASSMKPGQSSVADLLGKTYFKKGVQELSAKQYPQAISSFQKAKETDSQNGYIDYNVAEAYLFQKNYKEAEKSLNQALVLLPRSAEVYQRLGLVHEKQKKWDQAINAYKKANEINPSKALKEAIDRVQEMKKQ